MPGIGSRGLWGVRAKTGRSSKSTSVPRLAGRCQRVRTVREGEFGMLPAELATPLSLVINELATNAVEHGLAGRDGEVRLLAERYLGRDGHKWLRVTVSDNGHGLPEGEYSEGLGLQIVRTLVTSELRGEIHWNQAANQGTEVVIEMPLDLRSNAH